MGFLFVFWNKYRETYFEASQITKWTLVQLVITSVQTKAWAEKEISSKICSYPVCLVKSSLDKEGVGGWVGSGRVPSCQKQVGWGTWLMPTPSYRQVMELTCIWVILSSRLSSGQLFWKYNWVTVSRSYYLYILGKIFSMTNPVASKRSLPSANFLMFTAKINQLGGCARTIKLEK